MGVPSREEFLEQLRRQLRDLPQEEIDNAIRYYEEYLDEAGPENMEQVMAQLESPEKVAAQIRADLAVRQLESAPRPAKKGLSVLRIVGRCECQPEYLRRSYARGQCRGRNL